MSIRMACSLSMTRCVCSIHSRSFSLLTSLQKESVAMQTRTISTNAVIDLVDEAIVGTIESGTESLIGGTCAARYITNVRCQTGGMGDDDPQVLQRVASTNSLPQLWRSWE